MALANQKQYNKPSKLQNPGNALDELKLALKKKYNVLGDVNFFANPHQENKLGIIKNLNELNLKKQEDQGLLEFYKAKGMR